LIHKFRPKGARYLSPLVDIFIKINSRPNFLSFISLFFALLAGIFYALSGSNIWYLIPAFLFVLLNALFDFLDGEVARRLKKDSKRGDLVDHVIDRYADSFLLGGIMFGDYVPPLIGIAAIVGTLITSYLGTQAQALGLGRYYGGLLGRADRMMFIMVATLATFVFPITIFTLTIIGWLMVFFAVMTNLTAVQRFIYIWNELGDKR
jgi:phosphatidylglycerophosphate synthase